VRGGRDEMQIKEDGLRTYCLQVDRGGGQHNGQKKGDKAAKKMVWGPAETGGPKIFPLWSLAGGGKGLYLQERRTLKG